MGLRESAGANLPQGDMLAANLGKPLTSIPDPLRSLRKFLGQHDEIARLRAFLDTHFGFRQ